MKKRKSKKQRFKAHETGKKIVYYGLRTLVIFSCIRHIFRGEINNAVTCIIALLLFTLPGIFKRKFKVNLPGALEIIVYLFIFSAEILGEIQNFYGIFEHWDSMLHTINGFLAAAVGFSLFDILNRDEKIKFDLSPFFLALFSFCFSMTVAVGWEFGEYFVDIFMDKDSQKDTVIEKFQSVKLNKENKNEVVIVDNITKTEIYRSDDSKIIIDGGYLDIGLIDTMKDMLVNMIGAIVFSILGYLYVKDRDEYRFLERIIPSLDKT